MIVAVIGSGGREHAIVWKLQQSKMIEKVYVLPGNAGTAVNVEIDPNDFSAIRAFCQDKGVELIFVGPEAPLAAGIVDYFADTPVMVFGPEQKAASLESSKIWSKRFMQKYGVATAAFWEFSGEQMEAAQQKIEQLAGNCVLKYDGLAAGKGVYVCSQIEEAQSALQELLTNYGAAAEFLIEERLQGAEISILAFTDGKDYQLLQPSVDHKQLLAGDKGPNTGKKRPFRPYWGLCHLPKVACD
ncbi:MAG: phosphoribosylamine--glycine ligase, partial [Candidatus Cloacimonadales bacterium]